MNQTRADSNSGLEPLKVTCTASDCNNDLHCFKSTRELRSAGKTGACRSCGAELVNWDRIRKQDFGDAEHTFAAMRTEFIRHHFWHVDIDDKAFMHALRKGRTAFDAAVPKRICQSVGKAQPFRDGQQTPFTGNIIFYAQHATASCCRKCMEYWHGIPTGRPLSDEEIHYLANLVLLFIDERLPDLPKQGQTVPRSHVTISDPKRGDE